MDWTSFVTDTFEYISHSRLEYHHGYRHAYLGEVPQPVVYGVQGGLRTYYGAGEGPPVASTLDHTSRAPRGDRACAARAPRRLSRTSKCQRRHQRHLGC